MPYISELGIPQAFILSFTEKNYSIYLTVNKLIDEDYILNMKVNNEDDTETYFNMAVKVGVFYSIDKERFWVKFNRIFIEDEPFHYNSIISSGVYFNNSS